MKKTLLTLAMGLFAIFGHSQENLWSKMTESKLARIEKFERKSIPSRHELFSTDFSRIKNLLNNAPLDISGKKSNITMPFPDYNGKITEYEIYEAPVMEKGLSDKYPDIKSYVGKGITDKTATIRFSTTIFGLHAMMTSGEAGTYYIDTHSKDLNNYIVYSRKDVQRSGSFSCEVEENISNKINIDNSQIARATDGKFRQYRLAMACTTEYATYHVNAAGLGSGTLAQKKAAVLSAMAVTMTRINGVYERDMSLRMNLIANNEDIIFIDSDSFDNSNTNNILLTQSQSVIDATIGNSNYDIGHTVSTGGGGVASLGSVCVDSFKARGITGSPAPVGDPYDIDYVAHEMGHQFGGPHTFSGAGGSCSGNGSSPNAVEPASGTTIMAYAGICGPNVQSNSDAYFHAFSIASMNAHMIGTNCANSTNNNNTPPVISPLTNYTIPKGTAFVLTGNVTDVDPSAALTYCWEQTNPASGIEYPTSTQTTGPIYRSYNPTVSNKRYFPRLESVLSGNLTPTWEVTPSVARTLNFALTVRDNQTPTGGQTARSNMTVTVANSTAPFEVTSQNTNISWVPGAQETITWNVVGTDTAPYNSPNVNILFTSDNGATFTTLLANTPNDGSAQITVPNVTQPFCKIIVESIGNIFYAANKGNIAIGYSVAFNETCQTFNGTTGLPATIVEQNPLAYQNFTVAVPAMPGIIYDVNVSTNISHRVNQIYVRVNHPDNTGVQLLYGDGTGCNNGTSSLVTTFDDDGSLFSCASAGSNTTLKPTDLLNVLNGKTTAGTWRFRVADVEAGQSGTLNSFAFTICTRETIVTLNNNINEFVDLKVYPNPNSGKFYIEASSLSNNDVNISISDLRGRNIFEKIYKHENYLKKEVDLSSFQKGIYLMTISDGQRKSTKKIILE